MEVFNNVKRVLSGIPSIFMITLYNRSDVVRIVNHKKTKQKQKHNDIIMMRNINFSYVKKRKKSDQRMI